MNKNPIRCDKCGFFVAYKDIDSGAATRKIISLATEDSKEKWETICPKHNLEHEAKVVDEGMILDITQIPSHR